MTRKRLTERFPRLLPLRRKQKIFCFYLKMRMDGVRYARRRSRERLPEPLFESRCPMINPGTGFDLRYQENKVHNLKLAAGKLDGLLIGPGEVFSFYQAVRGADRETPYKEGLAEVNGKLTTEYGGGLCMLSNLLFWTLLHTRLTAAERHGHREKEFPEPESDAVRGVDAAVAEGWLDLKLRNDTRTTYQIGVGFEDDCIVGRVWADSPADLGLRVFNGPVRYRREGGAVWELAPVLRQGRSGPAETLYVNRCRIGYPLPEGTEIETEEERHENGSGTVRRRFAGA